MSDWDAKTIAKLSALWLEDLSTREISRRMGISKNAVVGKAHRLNLTSRPSPIRRGGEPKKTAVPRMGKAGISMHVPAPDVMRDDVAAKQAEQLDKLLSPRPAGSIKPCCWPYGDPKQPGFHFCRQPAEPGRPYCVPHLAVAFVKRGQAEAA